MEFEMHYAAKLLRFERAQATSGSRPTLPCDWDSQKAQPTICAEGEMVLEKLREVKNSTSTEIALRCAVSSNRAGLLLRKLWLLGKINKAQSVGPRVQRLGQKHTAKRGRKRYWRDKNPMWLYSAKEIKNER